MKDYNHRVLEELLEDIKTTKSTYDKRRKAENRHNIFNALYRSIDDEVRLHSRFISYLLSSTSNHNKKEFFADIFIKDIFKIEDFHLDNYTVYPNEDNKAEFKNIDILLINKQKQAIIIENKTRQNTPDSNDDKKPKGYQGQLERYYHTIHTGKDAAGKNIAEDFRCENPNIFYLSANGRQPSEKSIGTLKEKEVEVQCIHYESHITYWLKQCIAKLSNPEDVFLKGIIEKYLKIVEKMTNNDIPIEERQELKNKAAKDPEIIMYLMKNFKHIKWHTVADFWNKLQEELSSLQAYKEIKSETNNTNSITEITHNNRKAALTITFTTQKEVSMYICYDEKGLTFGKTKDNAWKYFNASEIQNINFVDFNNIETFALINTENTSKIVNNIIQEIEEEINNGFQKMYKEPQKEN